MGRGDDCHAQATENLWQIGGLGVHTQAWLGDAADTGESALAGRAVLEGDLKLLACLAILAVVDGKVFDVTFLLQDLSNVSLELGEGIVTLSWNALEAFRTRDNMSAIGSVMVMV
ncbi:hypothetical protein HMPREF2781_05735 [Corynebacterium sp. HMSC062A03]|nr:hypothetical protein HMPREF2781_05735 [Corynebacterium sp. HMSC062A03]